MKLRIAHLLMGDKIWGVERYALNLLSSLEALGVDNIAICASTGELFQVLSEVKVPIKVVPMRGYFDVEAMYSIHRILESVKPDVVHAHMGLDSFLSILPNALNDVPLIMSVHFEEPAYQKLPLPIRESWRLIQIVKNKQIARFLPVSDAVATQLSDRESVPLSKMSVICPGVPVRPERTAESRTAGRAEWAVQEDELLALTVARLSREKGLPTLVEAAELALSQNSKLKFVIAGEGAQRKKLQQLITKRNLDKHVHLAGHIPNVESLLHAADLFILPSESESFGIAAVEAMMVGLPVVGTRETGLSSIIEDQKTGILVGSNQAGDLSKAIVRLSENEQLRKDFGKAGRERALQEFTIAKMGSSILKVYEEVVTAKEQSGGAKARSASATASRATTGERARPIRVVQLVLGTRFWGVERYVFNLVGALKEYNVESIALCHNPDIAAEFRRHNLEALTVPIEYHWDLSFAYKLLSIVREFNADVIHAHLGIDSFIGTLVGQLANKPVILSVHFDKPAYMKLPAIIREPWRVVQMMKDQKIAHFLPITQNVANELNEREGIPLEKMTVVHPGLQPVRQLPTEAERNLIRQELGCAEGGKLLVSIARLEPEKGLDVLLKSIAQLEDEFPDLSLCICGEGSQRPQLEEMIKNLKRPQQVKLLGYVSDVGRVLSAADLFVLPSLFEPFGMAAVEAMMYEIPVIGTRGPGLSIIVLDKLTGLLVDPGDELRLTEAISLLLRKPKLAADYGKSGRARALKHFTDKIMAETTAKVYRNCVSS